MRDNAAPDSPAEADPPRPSACDILEDNTIKLTRCRGKSLAGNESFGYRIGQDRFLHLEEAIYLFDRGFLDVFSNGKELGLQELHTLLPISGVPLSYLLVYQHLRAQTFYTVRHSPQRHAILHKIEERLSQLDPSTPRTKATMQSDSVLSELREKLRQHARIPLANLRSLQLDCYKPGMGTYSSACPGVPDFCVAIAPYNRSASGSTNNSDLTFDEIQVLMREAQSAALKIATVSDSGIVIMLGVTDSGVPILTTD